MDHCEVVVTGSYNDERFTILKHPTCSSMENRLLYEENLQLMNRHKWTAFSFCGQLDKNLTQ
eukprot:c40559_g1_i1 orf=70-255(+)